MREIKGIVDRNPVILEECCIFPVRRADGAYLVVSCDRQAVKDHIFVREGQEISVRGTGADTVEYKGIILAERAKISLTGEESE